jgi:hypothetical protein
VRVFKTKAFERFARKAGVGDDALCRAVASVERGLVSANLGAGVIKQRIARRGEGKSGGFRAIILLRAGALAFFVHGFAKSDQQSIADDDLAALKKLAAIMLSYDTGQLKRATASGALIEIMCNGETIS